MNLESFDDVIASLRKKKRRVHLLLGNGFSISYDPSIFSYNALHDFITKLCDEDLSVVLSVLETRNFELIMQQLDHLAALIGAFEGDSTTKKRIRSASEKLRQGLLDAVRALHPEHVFRLPEKQSKSCAKFLQLFLESGGSIYSTNYDLLLYWVLMRNNISGHVDGCGQELLNPEEVAKGEEPELSELAWGRHRDRQNVFYVHGALQFFDSGVAIVKETYDQYSYLLERISARMEKGEYPIFVTAGDGRQKLTHIMHNHYLTHCYESLSSIEGSLVTFGFGFGDADGHIVDAINRAAKQSPDRKLWSVYIGTYSGEDRQRVTALAHGIRCKVHMYDAQSVHVWTQGS